MSLSGSLPGNRVSPEGGDDFRRVEPVHLIERGRQRECARSRVAVEDRAEPEPVVPCAWVMYTEVRVFPWAAIQPARRRA